MREEKRTGIVRKVATVTVLTMLGITGRASAEFFDWDERGPAGFIAGTPFSSTPFLSNSNAAAVAAQLATNANANAPLAIRVVEPLTNSASLALFNQTFGSGAKSIQFVFADYEGAASKGFTSALADTVLASSKSSGAYVGNFNFYPNASIDTTKPGSLSSAAHSYQRLTTSTDFTDSRGGGSTGTGNQYAAPALYPGAPDYRNPAAGNSSAPNIRSALFTLPIQRMTFAENGLLGRTSVPTTVKGGAYSSTPGSGVNIPYVTRFNNYGNPALGGGPSGTGFVQNAANPADGQLLSRGDFEAMILHYRMRGATGYNLFNSTETGGSVVGYTHQQAQFDVAVGNAASSVANGIFNSGHYAFANLTNLVGDGGGFTGDSGVNTEGAGVVWSGVFNTTGASRRLVILLSNLSGANKTIDFPNQIGNSTDPNGGFALFHGNNGTDPVGGNHGTDDFAINAGQHRILNFTLKNNRWELDYASTPFTDVNRNGTGVPEPTSLALAGLAGVGLLARRRRNTTTA